MKKIIFVFSLLSVLLILFSAAESKAAPPGHDFVMELSVEKAVVATTIEFVAPFDFAFNRFIVVSCQEPAFINEFRSMLVPSATLHIFKNQDELNKNSVLTKILLSTCNKLPDRYRNYGLSSGGMFN